MSKLQCNCLLEMGASSRELRSFWLERSGRIDSFQLSICWFFLFLFSFYFSGSNLGLKSCWLQLFKASEYLLDSDNAWREERLDGGNPSGDILGRSQELTRTFSLSWLLMRTLRHGTFWLFGSTRLETATEWFVLHHYYFFSHETRTSSYNSICLHCQLRLHKDSFKIKRPSITAAAAVLPSRTEAGNKAFPTHHQSQAWEQLHTSWYHVTWFQLLPCEQTQ